MKSFLLLVLLLGLATGTVRADTAPGSELLIYGLPDGGNSILLRNRCINCRSLPGAGEFVDIAVDGKTLDAVELQAQGIRVERDPLEPLAVLLRVEPKSDQLFPLQLRFKGIVGRDFRLEFSNVADVAAWADRPQLCSGMDCERLLVQDVSSMPVVSGLALMGLGTLVWCRRRFNTEKVIER